MHTHVHMHTHTIQRLLSKGRHHESFKLLDKDEIFSPYKLKIDTRMSHVMENGRCENHKSSIKE